ncbi:hypothetical protein PPACK8108_LOCUS9167 [Phakopsora pachyrhizi]|uniref:Uncharacterized protein n=1 Tax=Phakopsora pachyrhizi TaxID=170000 RepID=A0AAV0AVZ5_PHAPC|nr:hypothetical protein PPACK8108_LOCUS9167 [Phakopsora pachyrhizi]
MKMKMKMIKIASPNLINYQGNFDKGNKIPTQINPERLNQDPFFEGEPLPLDSNIKIGTPNVFTSNNLLLGSSEVQSSTIITQPIPNIHLSTITNLQKNTTTQNESTQISPSRAPNSISNESINNTPTSNSEPQSIANSSAPEMCNTIDNSEVANLQPLDEVVVSPPAPFFIQNGEIMNAFLANNCALSFSTWKKSLNSIIALIKNRKIDPCGEDLPTYLPSGVEIKSDYGTSISQWLNHLEDAVSLLAQFFLALGPPELKGASDFTDGF